ncbi:hypothetical protein [Caulobacter endophyticus]|uniref:hypothetical protein n=1 Tax=Caulobacter endophyticus TaxID=2172652 RepID=UPI00240F4FC8|nr:hypothetical protein [Caulobacter endophyticus]MDG2528025.1 hypothetical protein [Caulobacter endophyticus]
MDLLDRLERLETELARHRERAMAAEIVANVFFAHLLDLCDQIDEPIDLDLILERLAQDMTEAQSRAGTRAQRLCWERIQSSTLGMIGQIRDARCALRPANENAAH